MTYDPGFCEHCNRYVSNDWWHEVDCPKADYAAARAALQPQEGGN